jgi:hypothetical protein
VLWNQGIQTDREVLANRPNIIKNKKDRTCLVIDVAIPSDKKVKQSRYTPWRRLRGEEV